MHIYPLVKNLFKDIKTNMGPIIKEKGLKSEFNIAGHLFIDADSERVLQILRNLIINAVHFTDKGIITVSAKKKGEYVLFSVADTGEGIPKEARKKIFTKFYQADSSLTRKVGGSGLGLSISQGLVGLMHGKIWFDSVEGKGTTFYFTIPIAKGGKKNEETK